MRPNFLIKTLIASIFAAFLLSSCKKGNTTAPDRSGGGGNGSNPSAKTINDSIFFITKDIYLWTDALPDSATFKPDSYQSTNAMFEALKQYKRNSNGGQLDRYSFLDDGTTSRVLQGQAGDMGFEVGYQTYTTLYVIYVYPGSPADKAGIQRGWQLTAVNGTTSFNYDDATNTLLNNAFGSQSATFGFRKPDNTTMQVTLNATNYKLNPILYTKLFDFNGNKVGYFVFNNFVALNDVQAQFDSTFNAWEKAGVQQVIVDLRYNGGGMIETAEYLANKLVPAAKTNTQMYSQYFNNNVSNKTFSSYFQNMRAVPNYPTYNWTDIFYNEATTYKTTNFQKSGGLALNKLSFLVTRSTVSASELLYNVLKPSMSPRLVGDSTYGKPVGFINITFGQYDMYAVSFQTKNAAGEGDYFAGLPPQIKALDDYSMNWGDFNDPLLRAALTDMGVPATALGRMAMARTNTLARAGVNHLSSNRFKGMIQRIKR
ncbi:S41 family peptidase [Chitinophaga sp. 212800010-3]|uniref:S41 family peptidase n=1 Tax=unclassified Chitinophaga TaxID=2619133 RepID=UPI002DE34BD5|nr:PDZ domain-containing protein [Chitinophaga sp. 212800010-3]